MQNHSVQQARSEAAATAQERIRAQRRQDIEAAARDDARGLWQSGEDAVTLSYTSDLDVMADDSISLAAEELTEADIPALRPVYFAAFWRMWKALDNER